MSFGIKFWGVRGSIACPTPKHIGYGGNTSCIQVFAGDQRIILDAGTGIRGLGDEMFADDVTHADILLTHTHWDHINGFPFFAPAYGSTHSFNIMAGHLSKTGAELLFEVFSQRYERGSTLVTTNLPFDEWTEVFGSERLTGALLDRLTHHVNILEMNGESYRLNQSRRRQTPTAN